MRIYIVYSYLTDTFFIVGTTYPSYSLWRISCKLKEAWISPKRQVIVIWSNRSSCIFLHLIQEQCTYGRGLHPLFNIILLVTPLCCLSWSLKTRTSSVWKSEGARGREEGIFLGDMTERLERGRCSWAQCRDAERNSSVTQHIVCMPVLVVYGVNTLQAVPVSRWSGALVLGFFEGSSRLHSGPRNLSLHRPVLSGQKVNCVCVGCSLCASGSADQVQPFH